MRVASRRVHMMGTFIDLQVEAASPEPLIDDAVAQLRVFERRCSANDPSSELGQVNAEAGQRSVSVHPDLFKLIAVGVEHSLAEDSLLNIAIGPLVQLWRIGFHDARVPGQDEIEQALTVTDPSSIELDSKRQSVFLRKPGMKIDLGALAKGYFADRIVGLWQDRGANSGLINLGGNVLTFGQSPHQDDGLWRVGLRHPLHPDPQVLGALTLPAQSVVTSGVYQRTLKVGGRTFHHLMDPRTGYPIDTDVISLTIVSARSFDGEIWTTRLFGQSVVKILREVEQRPHLQAVAITEDLRLYASGTLRNCLTLQHTSSTGR
ncbi:FAD:protein FMN transferase [Corynebacterium cystitidis]|uniref:FAD:protein FMN transferase n=1 Tax=Corynebacterium cystitidis TaxID=35757 RepID=UPI00211F3EFC|nr:FAD:protein FMN transferase [Corynebacterium cystitidis]